MEPWTEGPIFVISKEVYWPHAYHVKFVYWSEEKVAWIFEFASGAYMLVSPEFLEAIRELPGKPVEAKL